MSMDIFGLKDVLTVRRFTSWFFFSIVDVINVSGHKLSMAEIEIESALIMHKGVAETAGTFY
jgi:acyl-coenzyme A synthetase/AMP-(fatty) acid ligase